MEELIKTFHLDWKLLLAQIINFSVVIAILWIFALKPLMKIMKEREERIAKSLSDAELIEENLKNSDKEKQKKINEGRKEAQKLINSAEKEAEEIKRKKLEKAQAEVEKVIVGARQQISAERELMVEGVKEEMAGLILLAVNKITKKGIDAKAQERLIDESIREIKNQPVA